MLEDRLRGQTQIAAPQPFGHAGVQRRHALDVGLVDERPVPRGPGRHVAGPGEGRVDHDAFRQLARAVSGVLRQVLLGVPDRVAEDLIGRADRARDRHGVGVQEQLVGVEPMAGLRVVGAVDAIAVELARADVRQVAVPHVVRALLQLDAERLLLVSRGLEQTEVDGVGVLREQGEVDALSVPRRPQRVGLAGPDSHQSPSRR